MALDHPVKIDKDKYTSLLIWKISDEGREVL
jgi:hypothetical protein